MKILGAFLTLVRDPSRTDQIFAIGEENRRSVGPAVRGFLKGLARHGDFVALYEERYLPPPLDVDALRGLPDRTLGREFMRHLDRNGLKPDFFPVVQVESMIDYVILRLRQTHDIWHVVTGFDTSVEGEIGLQAFVYAQIRSPLSALLILGGLLHTVIYRPGGLVALWREIRAGHKMGRRSRFLLGVRIENFWDLELTRVRRDIGICGSCDHGSPITTAYRHI